MKFEDRRFSPDTAKLTDWLLGELSPQAAAHMARRLGRGEVKAQDLELARELAEVQGLLDDLRQLRVEPSGRVPLAVRHAIHRRNLQAGRLPRQPLRLAEFVSGMVQVAAVALVAFAGLSLGRWGFDQVEPDQVPKAHLAAVPQAMPLVPVAPVVVPEPEPAPVHRQPSFIQSDPYFRQQYENFAAHAETPPFAVWCQANRDLAILRREFRQRFSADSRRRIILAGGGSRILEPRIQALAAEVAAKVDGQLAAAEVSVPQLTLALRALLAAGSTPRMGPHQATVRRCAEYLEQRVAGLQGGELASALAGLMDLAVVTGRRMETLVAEHSDRLTHSIFQAETPVVAEVTEEAEPAPSAHRSQSWRQDNRPSLLHWQTPAAQLADAGRVLQLAPAFGAEPKLTNWARTLLAAHLDERINASSMERPDLLAAQLYGFADLVDRAAIDRKLLLWRAQNLVPEHYVALHHLSWSQFPARPGWSRFQRELRMLSVQSTPEGTGDASALLLCLAMNYAAPGSSELALLARH